MYRALRPLLFRLEPERAHELTLRALRVAETLRLAGRGTPAPTPSARRLMGLEFPNRVGLAAGFDKNGTCIDALAGLGFGFIEIGTLTPLAQAGNPRPRLFRVPHAHALINRMGFPNVGAEAACARLRRRRASVLGINIGKNAATPVSRAVDDYLTALRIVYPHADYIALNVSSPNTTGLRELEQPERLGPLLQALIEARATLAAGSARRVPLLVKLSPDLSAEELEATARTLAAVSIDGVIATNSTVQRALPGEALEEAGGLSGAPLLPLATQTVRRLRTLLGPGFPIIGVGGIDSAQSARAMLDAGADLIQLYTGLVYRGPRLPRLLSQL
jgi:dihydroorotate dehydrogenase